MNVKKIEEEISAENIPDVLLIGNGIARAASETSSWEDIIKSAASENKVDYDYEDFKALPANMQIVVATKNHVDSVIKSIVEPMLAEIDCEASDFLRNIAAVNAGAVLNTNYDYNIEQALGVKAGKGSFQRCRRWTKDVNPGTNDKNFNLFQYSDVALNKKIWHIHGDVCSPKYMVMGHRYYGSLLHQIQNYVPSFFAQFKQKSKSGEGYSPKSWVDYFLTGNIYILGFGMYSTETDLWWLLDCKKEHFKDTEIVYYAPAGDIDKNTEILLKTYDVEIVDSLPFHNGGYKEYYLEAVKDINRRIDKSHRS